MRVLLAGALAGALLLAGCSDDSPTATRPTTTPTTSAAVDPFAALEPPTSPGVGSFDVAIARRAYDAAHGLLAQSLAEPGTLTGTGTADLLESLAVPDPELSVARYLRPPTRRGLDLRPLFGRGVSLDSTPVEVVRSTYTGDEVRGAAGEQGIRISWDGAVRYRVVRGGQRHEVAYVLHVGYVFATLPNEPGGIRLMQVVPGTSHAAPVIGACLSKGLLVPAPGAPSASDFGAGPWPPPQSGGTCPV